MENFDAQAELFAQEIEEELAEGRLNFPTSLDVSMRIKRLADDPNSSLDQIATVVKAEPVLAAKAVRMANSVALNPYGIQITSVKDAVVRIGLAAVRCLAFAVAAEQLAQDHRSRIMRQIASGLWLHTVDVAAWSFAIARRLRVVNPDTALFAGMMVDIGQFFLLARASSCPDLEKDMPRFVQIVDTWNRRIAVSVMEALELPEIVIDAVAQQQTHEPVWPPASLPDVLAFARIATEVPHPLKAAAGTAIDRQTQLERYPELPELLGSVEEERQSILKAVRG